MNCSGCGADIETDISFCPKCGTKVGAAPTGPLSNRLDSSESSSMEPDSAFSRSNPAADDSEVKLWSGGYSGKAMVGGWIAAAILSALLIAGSFIVPPGAPAFIGVMLLIWFALIVVLVYRKLSIHYDVTSQRFNHQSGILTRTSDRIEMIDIDDVTFTQGIVERMFNVGTIKLSSSDRTHPVLQLIGISDVKRVADIIDDARRKERRKRGLHIENI